jgi:hypothetical protein
MGTSTFLFLFVNSLLISFTSQEKKPESFRSRSKQFEVINIDLASYCKIDGKAKVIKIFRNSADFKVTDKNHESYDFWMNANYFMENGTPLGEVKIKGKTIHRKNSGGGFFTTDGKDPKFYFGTRPQNVKYSSQTHTPVINKGNPNYKIFNRSWAKIKVPRLMIGEDSQKNIYICHTTGISGCSIQDFYKLASKLKLKNVLMFDGGASIEVGIKKGDFTYRYQKVSDLERDLFNVPAPKVFIVGNFR